MAFDELKERSRAVWDSGEYRPTGEHLAPVSDIVLDAVDVRPGMRLLDVAAGDGNCAIAAARRGAGVLATDFSPVQVERGRGRTADAGVDVAWQEADAADLPFPDGSFDRVTSVFGAIFAPEHEVVARELVRVTRPGGAVGMTSWVHDGLNARLQEVSRSLLPPAGSEPPPDPYLWGEAEYVKERFAAFGCPDVAVQHHTLSWRFPSWAAWRENAQLHGMAVVSRRLLGEERFTELLDRQQAVMEEVGREDAEGVAFTTGYVVMVVAKPT